MAFRGYEMNLILRVQDRATARLRRLSQDIGGVSRAADLQRQGARIAQARTRNNISMAKSQEALASRTAATGAKNLQNQAQLLRLKAQELGLQNRLNTMGLKNPVLRQQLTMRLSAVQKDILRIQTLQTTEQNALNAAIAESVALEANLAREAELVAAAQARAERAAAFQRRARMLTHVGSVSALAGGIGVIASAGAASQFAEFNRQSVAAATQMRGVNETFASTVKISKVLETSLVDLTKQFPATAQEMSDSIYEIASGMDFQIDRTSRLTETQQRFNQSFKILKLANKVAVAGNLDLKTATDALIFTFNNFDPAIKNPIKDLNELFAVVRFGKGTFAEFAPQIGRVAAAANAAGQNLVEAGGALAFLSQHLPLSQATTALVRIFQIVGRKEFTRGFQELFKTSPFVQGTRRLKNLSEIMFIIEKQGPRIWPGFKKGSVDLMNVLQNITAAGQNAIKGTTDAVGLQSTEFARRAVANFVIFGDQYRSTLANVSGTQKEFLRSFQAFREQPGVQWQIAINQFKAFAIVVGQEVLPAMLKFIDFVGRLVKRFEDLSPHTRHLIGQFAAWGSIALLVGGAITSLIGGIGILIGRIGLFSMSLAPTVGRLGALGAAVRNLAAIGAISIILKTVWTGDASAKDFLLGAIMGGVAGAQIGGLPGAAIGAITVPVILKIITHYRGKSEKSPIEQAYQDYQKRFGLDFTWFWEKDPMKSFKEFERDWNAHIKRFKIPLGVEAVERNRSNLHHMMGDIKTTSQSMLEKWQQLAADLTGVDLFGGATQNVAKSMAMMSLQLAKAMAGGNKAQIRAAIQRSIAADLKEITRLSKLPMTPERVKALTQLYQDVASLKGQLESMSNAAVRAAKKEKSARDRANKAYETAADRVDRLKLKFKQLREQEIDKLRSAFGDVFGGPLMQGPIGQMFTQISSTLAGFGQTFAIPASLILQDQKAQQKQFDTLMSDLNFLQKRGVQSKTIQNILSQGPSAIPFLEGIRRAPAGQQREFIANLKQRNSTILQALQSPFEKQLTASNIQLQAAQLQMKAAQRRLGETKAGKTAAGKPAPTRATQSVTHNHNGDTITVHADGATTPRVLSALNRAAFNKRHRK